MKVNHTRLHQFVNDLVIFVKKNEGKVIEFDDFFKNLSKDLGDKYTYRCKEDVIRQRRIVMINNFYMVYTMMFLVENFLNKNDGCRYSKSSLESCIHDFFSEKLGGSYKVTTLYFIDKLNIFGCGRYFPVFDFEIFLDSDGMYTIDLESGLEAIGETSEKILEVLEEASKIRNSI